VPWSFAKLRFRRIITLRTLGNNERVELNSPFTQPFWVQFAPEFSLLSGHHPSAMRVRWDGPRRVTTVDCNNNPIAVLPQGAMFERYLLLTRRISDAYGDKTHEAYLAVFKRDGNSGSWVPLDPDIDKTPAALKSQLRARIIDVHRHASAGPISNERTLWERIFSRTTKDTDRARIVGVSRPIESAAVRCQTV
jgi:hypothetical protein